jgi:uncharacterized membrane protein YgdD (TMEM256/DUF423 family)
MNSDRLFLSISILGVAIGILFGAFGAHALKDLFSNYEMDIWNKGIYYQIINSLGIMILLILRKNNFIKKTNSPFYFLILGIIFFSFSLYAISLTNVFLSSEHWIKTLMIPVTPLGGSLIILGWVLTVLKINK